jgi:asparagine synthase (glutamine-hydrolysing)
MCGITGVVSTAEGVSLELLVRMRDTLRHRGPDDEGVWRSPDGVVGFAHRRLAIIDLSPAGHQPMVDASGCLQIVFNGEIYNFQSLRRELEGQGHRFGSASDTEVILAAYRQWGTDCVKRLNGMFAFALYDHARQLIFIARDRAGEKPLFYRHSPRRFAFASELKALMADPAMPRVLDRSALDYYLAAGYVPGHLCMLQGVRKLPPAHALTYEPGRDRLEVWRYWDVPAPATDDAATTDDLLLELAALLRDSVKGQLIADVPIGILLSGGIDSSLVTAFAAEVSSRPVKTFTISFPGHGTYDEGPHARLVAQHFGTEHLELEAEPASVDLLPTLARQYDEPIGDSSMVPTYLVSRLVRQHATVALGGDGGDELFGGYPWYNELYRLESWRRRLPRAVRSLLAATATRVMPVGLAGRKFLVRLGASGPSSLGGVMLFDDWSRRMLRGRTGRNGPANEISWPLPLPPRGSDLQTAQAVDLTTYMPDDILAKVDRASMLTSLEVRAPLLDYRIIEFAFRRVPDHLKVTATERKILTRMLAARVLPRGLDLRRKQGFSVPIETWFRGEWGRYLSSVLAQADPELFDQRFIARLIRRQRQGYTTNGDRLFALAMFELWRREYRVAPAA